LEEAASLTGDPCFGLHFGERYNPKNIGPLAYVVLNSPTIAAAIENAARYLKIHNGAAKASLIIEIDRACLRFSPNELLIHGSRQHSEYAMVVALFDGKQNEVDSAEAPTVTCQTMARCRKDFGTSKSGNA
jgi:Arabinose-binding domain of AraC transcription regulator, N-term